MLARTIILACYVVAIGSGFLLLWKAFQPLNAGQRRVWSTEIPRLKVVIRDQMFLLILGLTITFCLFGIQWGRYESWNPDQMALKGIYFDKTMLFPSHYLKPPFHTYLNFLLSFLPIKIIQKAFGLSLEVSLTMMLVWSRILTAGMLLGSIIIAHQLVFAFFGRHSALVVSALFGTSAGFITYSHFLTADIPVMFWMMCALFWSTKAMIDPQYRNYIIAGIFTGLATATKYNGLAVGISIPVAHLLYTLSAKPSWKALIFDSKPVAGVFAVPMGFLIGSPLVIADYSRFLSDFYYNYVTTPVYWGTDAGNSYLEFWHSINEVFGAPLFVVVILSGVLLVAGLIRLRDLRNSEYAFLCLVLCVFLLYYVKLAAFPRWETRFALPILPILLICTSVFWARLESKIRLLVCVPLIAYGGVCSLAVGARFLDDPRMDAQIWMSDNVRTMSSIESSPYVPNWSLMGYKRAYRMPSVSGRARALVDVLRKDEWALAQLKRRERDQVEWFTKDALHKRSPDFIAVNSLYYGRFLDNELYPELKFYFRSLLNEEFDYCIIFDHRSPNYPAWIYPRDIEFLNNRMVILKRKPSFRGDCRENVSSTVK